MTNRSLTKTFNRAVKSATTTRRARNSDKNDGCQQSLSGTLGRRCFEAFLATQPSATNALPQFCRCAPPLSCAPPIEHDSSARGNASMYVPPLVFTARPHLATRSKGQKKGVGETAGRNVQKTRTAVGHHLTRFLGLGKQSLSAVQQR